MLLFEHIKRASRRSRFADLRDTFICYFRKVPSVLSPNAYYIVVSLRCWLRSEASIDSVKCIPKASDSRWHAEQWAGDRINNPAYAQVSSQSHYCNLIQAVLHYI